MTSISLRYAGLNNRNVIYGLIDPNTQQLRYIGRSTNVGSRYCMHHCPYYLKPKNHRTNWIKSLLKKNQVAILWIIEEYDNREALPQAEIEMIEYYKWLGCDLVNGTTGGTGGLPGNKRSKEFVERFSKLRMGHPVSDETKKKMSISQRKRMGKMTQETVDAARKEHKELGTSMRKLAKKYGIGFGAMQCILTNKTWKPL